MSQAILIESNKNLSELISINLRTYVGIEPIPRKDAEDAISLLSILPSIDLIITNASIDGEKTIEILLNYIETEKLNINLVVLGSVAPELKSKVFEVPDKNNWELVVKQSAKILGVTEESLKKKSSPDYIPVSIKYFLKIDSTPCDVFIRIKKNPTEFQFVKRIHANDNYSSTVVKKYMEQGLKNFYISREMEQQFTNFLSNHLVKKLEEKFEDETKMIMAISDGYEVAINEITKSGFTSATIQLTDSVVNNIIKSIKQSPQMNALLHKIINSKSGMMYQKCHMTSVIAAETLKLLGISDVSEIEKLCYASFFHDIMLVEKEELTSIDSFEELEAANLPEADWDLVFNHALDAANLILQHPAPPKEVDEIIKQHHGANNGKGFSTKNVGSFDMLSQVFIVSSKFVRELFEFKKKGGEPSPIINKLFELYPDEKMIIVINALEKALKKKAPSAQ